MVIYKSLLAETLSARARARPDVYNISSSFVDPQHIQVNPGSPIRPLLIGEFHQNESRRIYIKRHCRVNSCILNLRFTNGDSTNRRFQTIFHLIFKFLISCVHHIGGPSFLNCQHIICFCFGIIFARI